MKTPTTIKELRKALRKWRIFYATQTYHHDGRKEYAHHIECVIEYENMGINGWPLVSINMKGRRIAIAAAVTWEKET